MNIKGYIKESIKVKQIILESEKLMELLKF